MNLTDIQPGMEVILEPEHGFCYSLARVVKVERVTTATIFVAGTSFWKDGGRERASGSYRKHIRVIRDDADRQAVLDKLEQKKLSDTLSHICWSGLKLDVLRRVEQAFNTPPHA